MKELIKYNHKNIKREEDNSMQYKEFFYIVRDDYTIMKFDCKESLVSTMNAFNGLLCTIFGDDYCLENLGHIESLINSNLGEIKIISSCNKLETFDSETKKKIVISNGEMPGRCFKNENGKYNIVAIGADSNTGYSSEKIHIINHELAHFFTNILSEFINNQEKLEKDNGVFLEKVSNGGIDILDKQSRQIPKNFKGVYKLTRYYEEYNETLKDIIASISIYKQEGQDVVKIFTELPEFWINLKTTYMKTIPLTQLAIAAFSNYSFKNYVNNDKIGIINGNIVCNNGEKMKLNDFLFGMSCNPFHVENKFEQYSESEVSLKKLTEISSSPVFQMNEGKFKCDMNILKKGILFYCNNLTAYLKMKLISFKEKASHDDYEIYDILTDYNKVLKNTTEYYGIDYFPINVEDIFIKNTIVR